MTHLSVTPTKSTEATLHPRWTERHEGVMACTCLSLGVWRRRAAKAARDDTVSPLSCLSEHSGSPETPQMVLDQDDTLSLASCSLSTVDAGGYQDPLLLNIPHVPMNASASRRPSLLSRESHSPDLPQVYLARTQASKEETSTLQEANYQHTTRSGIGSTHLVSGGSLELATDVALAQLDTALQGPISGLSPRNLRRGGLSANPAALTTLPGNLPVYQERGSNISPFAQLASHVISFANSHAAQSAEPAAAISSSLPGQASSRRPDGDTEEGHPCSDSATRMAAAVQEAEACRTSSDDGVDDNCAPEILDCSTSQHRKEDPPGQGGFGGALSPKKHSGTEQPPTDSCAMEFAPGGPETKALVAHQVVQLAANGAAVFSEPRAHRRRTRLVTVLPDQENLLANQAAILGCPQSAVQKPLKSRTNLRGRHAGSLQAACDPCDGDALLRAALCTTSSWDQAGQHTWTREDAYKPLSAQLTCTDLTDSNSKRTWAPTPNAWGATERAAAESGLKRDQKLEPDRSRVGAPNAGKRWWAYPVPTYMRSTCSVRAKADVAMEQIKACKESQRDRRRWTY